MMSGFIAPADFTLSDSLILVSIVILGDIANAWSIFPAATLIVVLSDGRTFRDGLREFVGLPRPQGALWGSDRA
jgi:hypothetical protein